MNAWCTLEMLQPQAVLRNVLEICTAKFHGRLQDWYIRLGEYRQLQLVQMTMEDFFRNLYGEFLGEPDVNKAQAREDYLQMR